MLRFFQRLFGQSSQSKAVQTAVQITHETRKRSYKFMQEFSDETSREYTILGLQRNTGVLEEYHLFNSENKKETVTSLTVEENGEQRELTFPGAIPEAYFPQLLRQKIKLAIKESAFYDPGVGFIGGCEWRCTQDHVLEVLTGDLVGQQFKGHRYWLDDYPLVVIRVNHSTQATA